MSKFLPAGALMLVSMSAAATTTYGPVENFDVINDTGTTAHGFEIRLHGIHKSDITSMFGDASRWPGMERYGVPSVSETTDANGQPLTIVTYVGNYNPGAAAWNAGTPSGTLPVSPADSCWPLGNANYGPNFPCDHFGVSSSKPATAVEYNWLLENGSPGSLTGVSSNIPQVTWVPPAAPQPNLPLPQPAPAIKIAPPPQPVVPPPVPQPVYEFGTPKWYKVTATGYGYNVAVEDLVAENAAVKLGQNTHTEWQLLQTDSGNPNAGQVDLTGVAPDPGYKSIVYRFEVWEYTGALDPQTHQAFPVNGDTAPPAAGDIGNFLGAQHAAVNLDGQVPQPVLPVAPVINNSLPDGVAGVAYNQLISVTPGNAGDAITMTVTGLPPGLTFNGIDTVAGTPTQIGTYNVSINAYDNANQLSASSSVSMNVTDTPIVFTLTNTSASTGSAFSLPLAASGGYAPFTYAVSAGTLPAGLSVSGSAISGIPSVAGTFPLTITATDSAGGSQTATVTITVVDASIACSADSIAITSVASPFFTDANNISVNFANATATFAPGLTQGAYAVGQVVSYSGVMDPGNTYCQASTTSVALPLGLTATLPAGTAGTTYTGSSIKVTGGWSPYTITVSGLPSGLVYSNGSITGSTAQTGTFPIAISVVDSKNNIYNFTSGSITINAAGSCTTPAGSKSLSSDIVGKVTAVVGSNPATVSVGAKSFVANNCTSITWSGNWSGLTKAIRVGYSADVSKGYTYNGVTYAKTLNIDNGL